MKLKLGIEYSDKISWFQYPSTLCRKNFGLQIKNLVLEMLSHTYHDPISYLNSIFEFAKKNFKINFYAIFLLCKNRLIGCVKYFSGRPESENRSKPQIIAIPDTKLLYTYIIPLNATNPKCQFPKKKRHQNFDNCDP